MRKIRDWPVVAEFVFIQSGYLQLWRDDRLLESGMKMAGNKREVDNVGDCRDEYG